MKTELNGKIAVVTGAGKEPAISIIRELAANGARVVACDEKEENARNTAELLKREGLNCEWFELDVTSQDEIYNKVNEFIDKFGYAQILVNAESDWIKPEERMLTADLDFDRYLEVADRELIGLYYISKAFMREMEKNGGGIVINITSMLGLAPKKGCIANASTAAATMSLSRVWALEMDKKNIRVHCIARGNIAEEQTADEEELIHQATKKQVTAKDVANAVLYLASDEAEMSNGCILTVDGALHYGYMRNF